METYYGDKTINAVNMTSTKLALALDSELSLTLKNLKEIIKKLDTEKYVPQFEDIDDSIEELGGDITTLETTLKNYVDDKYGAHAVWEVDNPINDGIGAVSGKAREVVEDETWSLTGLNFSNYKYALCYIKGCTGTNVDQEGSSIIVRVELEDRFKTPRINCYCGTSLGYALNDNGVKAGCVIVIDPTKTKAAMIFANFNTTGTTALTRDYKLYKIEGYKA